MGSSSQMWQPAQCALDGCDQDGTYGIPSGGGKGPPPGYSGGFYCSKEHVALAEAQLKAQAQQERKAYQALRDRIDGRLPVLLISKRKARAGLSWLARSSSGW